MSRTLTLATASGDMPLFEIAPEGPALGGVVVFQDAFGVNDYLKEVCGSLAAEGYHAVAPHLYHRGGETVLEYGPAEAVTPYVQALTEEGLLADIDASLRHLAASGFTPSRTAVVGFCQGGTVCFAAAIHNALGAAVTFYGGGIAEGRFGFPPMAELAPKLQTPWLGLYGDLDLPSDHGAGIPVEEVEALRRAAAAAAVPTEIVRYPEAGHAFHCHARPELYHRASAEDGWRRTLGWLAAHLHN